MAALGWTEQEQFRSPREDGFVHAMPGQMMHATVLRLITWSITTPERSAKPGRRTEAQSGRWTRDPRPHGHGRCAASCRGDGGASRRCWRRMAHRRSGPVDGGEWRANAELTTDLDLAAVTEHYTRQLEGAGWQRSSHGDGDRPCAGASGTSPTKMASHGERTCSSSSDPTSQSTTSSTSTASG